ncbi:hypothetical protein [Bradyrhizobium icense]|uniref:LysE family translocator n=1 Tax=Bradyrhizobium icense TaxID=1274631 RepID=A0A1B1UN56_9BRAD|nr:hypothetical protein [Bradyrhizobium icense]ANW04135.1 hypothetical protein LMTR13_32310 [Bradyrhizobium icense]
MTSFIAHLLPAVALGLCVAVPFGPFGLMCVQRTLGFGIWFGIASGMGAATAHAMFSFLALVSGTALMQMTFALHTPLRIASARSMISGLPVSSTDVTPRYGNIVIGLAAAINRVVSALATA